MFNFISIHLHFFLLFSRVLFIIKIAIAVIQSSIKSSGQWLHHQLRTWYIKKLNFIILENCEKTGEKGET